MFAEVTPRHVAELRLRPKLMRSTQLGSDLRIPAATDAALTALRARVLKLDVRSDSFNLVQTMQARADFSILVEALDVTDLITTLSSTGPFTLLAPTNTAFAQLFQELGLSKTELLANKALLARVLSCHLLRERWVKADLPFGAAIATQQGESFTVDTLLNITDRNGRKCGITATDLFAGNGVVHVLDKVLLPKLPSTVELAQSQPQFSILVEAVVAAGLVSVLSGPTALTVLAPTNDAFAALLGELQLTKAQLLANTSLLTQVLTYHVLPGRIYRSGVPVGVPITTLGGGRFSVNAALAITDARARLASITATDSLALNGVLHTLNRVILPAA